MRDTGGPGEAGGSRGLQQRLAGLTADRDEHTGRDVWSSATTAAAEAEQMEMKVLPPSSAPLFFTRPTVLLFLNW